jgi:hypothetical protein
VAEGDGVAGERLRVEARPSTVSPVRRAGSYVVNLLAELFGLAAPFGWPRIDVVVIDVPTGRTLRTWHETGDDASALLSVLNEELAEMPHRVHRQVGPALRLLTPRLDCVRAGRAAVGRSHDRSRSRSPPTAAADRLGMPD